MTRGLVFGKFYPPHAGHHHLIRTAEAGCDALTVLVLSGERQTIDGELRARWLREAHPNARVLHVRDDGPQSWPEEDEDAWRAFVALVRAHHPEPEDFVAIAREQNAREDAAAATSPGILICDTDAFATAIWHERYLGAPSPAVRALVRDPALYLFTQDDLPFVQDGTRDGEHVRAWMTRRFREELLARGVPFVEITGTGDARTNAALRAVQRLMPEPAVRGS